MGFVHLRWFFFVHPKRWFLLRRISEPAINQQYHDGDSWNPRCGRGESQNIVEVHEKRAQTVGWVRMKSDPQLYRDYFINHDIRIPSLTNQDSMESRRVFFVAQLGYKSFPPWQFCENVTFFGMVSENVTRTQKRNRDLQGLGIKRSRLESPGPFFSLVFFAHSNL